MIVARGYRALGVMFAGALASGCDPTYVDAFEPIDCNEVPESDACRFDVWPNSGSSANSDRWLSVNHDRLRQIRPRLLVLNFDNDSRGDEVLAAVNLRIKALAEGSRYHGYANPDAPVFLQYEVAAIVDYTDADPEASPYESSTHVPVGDNGIFDVHQLFSPEFQFLDPSGSKESVGLCELFERGAVNEVWLAVSDPEREPALMLERKQRYDASMAAIPGDFNPCMGDPGDYGDGVADYCLQVECGVTVRFAHLNPDRGTGCDLQVRGWSIVHTGRSIPYFEENATAFFNADFRQRFPVNFDAFADICEPNMPCVSYPGSDVAEAEGVEYFKFEPYRQGCGSPEFPSNASTRYDWENIADSVSSRCEHYGLGDGENGADAYDLYDFSKVAVFDDLLPEDPEFPDQCGGGWQMYWRQSMPGLDNPAIAADGQRMKNWWPFMFY